MSKEDAFYSSLNKILLVAAAGAFGGMGLRFGSEPMTDELRAVRDEMREIKEEVSAVRKDVKTLNQDYNRRLTNLETLYLPRE